MELECHSLMTLWVIPSDVVMKYIPAGCSDKSIMYDVPPSSFNMALPLLSVRMYENGSAALTFM